MNNPAKTDYSVGWLLIESIKLDKSKFCTKSLFAFDDFSFGWLEEVEDSLHKRCNNDGSVLELVEEEGGGGCDDWSGAVCGGAVICVHVWAFKSDSKSEPNISVSADKNRFNVDCCGRVAARNR